jgi:hypothetical protein
VTSPTSCHLDTCADTAHVVVFATAAQFAGRPTETGHRILLCLLHGGQVYDAIRAWRRHRSVSAPTWLVDDLKADRLPQVKPDWHGADAGRRARRRHNYREPP